MKLFLIYLTIFLSVAPAIFIHLCFILQLKKILRESDEDIYLKDILFGVFMYFIIIAISFIPLLNIFFIRKLYNDVQESECFILINKILNYKVIKRSKNNSDDIKDVKKYYKSIKRTKKIATKYQKKILDDE